MRRCTTGEPSQRWSVWQQYEDEAANVRAMTTAGEQQRAAEQILLPLRVTIVDLAQKTMTHQLQLVSSMGDLGQLTNIVSQSILAQTIPGGFPSHDTGASGMLMGRNADQLRDWLFADSGGCGNVTFQSCLADPSDARVFPETVVIHDASMTLEKCAASCLARSFSLSGVEFGVACFCANEIPAGAVQEPDADCHAKPCSGNASQACGGASRLYVYTANCTAPKQLPPEALLQHEYLGKARVFVPTVRTLAEEGEVLTISATVLATQDQFSQASVVLHWRQLGGGQADSAPMVRVARERGVFRAKLGPLTTDVEWFVDVTLPEIGRLVYPPGAPSVWKSVIVAPAPTSAPPAPAPTPTPKPAPKPAPRPSPTLPQPGLDTLLPGDEHALQPGRRLVSASGSATLEMQSSDGNLVLRDANRAAVWASGTTGHPHARLVLQVSDGNLVIYDAHKPLWSSGPSLGATRAVLQDDCRFIVSSDAGDTLWSLGDIWNSFGSAHATLV